MSEGSCQQTISGLKSLKKTKEHYLAGLIHLTVLKHILQGKYRAAESTLTSRV